MCLKVYTDNNLQEGENVVSGTVHIRFLGKVNLGALHRIRGESAKLSVDVGDECLLSAVSC